MRKVKAPRTRQGGLTHVIRSSEIPVRFRGPNALRRVRIQKKMKVGEYLVADSIEAVVSLAQMGIVEIHTWNSTADDVERPNRIVWDLVPARNWRGSRSLRL